MRTVPRSTPPSRPFSSLLGPLGPLVALALLGLLALGRAAPLARDVVRVGTYDTRAIAVAYAASRHNPVAAKQKEHEAARKAGDAARVRELEAWGAMHQRQLHFQGFSRVPVGDLLAPVQEVVAALALSRGLDVLTAFPDHRSERVEVVDVTDDLVKLYEPSAKTLATIEELLERAPLDLAEVSREH